ncbi:MAG: GNAT family N-acetyltransferase [Rhodothermales bacterium]|nr:GNAT family N-acetyltransferase [Rhodothermales bacterium]
MPSAKDAILSAHSPEARERWEEMQSRCPTRGAFDDFDLVTGLSHVQQLQCEVLVTSVDNEDQFGAILPFRRIGPFRDAILPRFCPTSPVLIPTDAPVAVRSAAIESALACMARRYHRVSLHLTADVTPLVSNDAWGSTPLYTYRLDLTKLTADITATWSAGTRRLYRKNVESYRVEETADTATAVQLCWNSYARAGRPLPIDQRAMSEFAHQPPGDVSTRTFLATNRDSNVSEAGLVVLQHGGMAFYWIAGSMPGPGMTVMIGHVLQVLRESGLTDFDFLGANTPSIAEFKRRFGPTLHEYTRMASSRSWLLDSLLAARNRFR